MESEAKYYNAFNLVGSIGPIRFKRLSACFGNLENAWHSSDKEMAATGIGEAVSKKITEARRRISPDLEWEKLIKEKISAVTIHDAAYPKLLKETYSPPAILYFRGELKDCLEFTVGIVGSRRISSYGRQVTEDMAGSLARAGATIVSGMALGVDTASHEAAIKNGTKTIAVLGSGLDERNLYSRKKLADRIVENGALVSEHPYGMPAFKSHFPMRNRIIAGLSLGVLVIEAAERSASLITVKYALEGNREIFAVPGSIYWPNSAGTNNLIKAGAKAVTNYKEILEDLGLTKIENCITNRKVIASLPEEQTILSVLSIEPLHIDAISQKTKINAAKIASTITLMEMKGVVKNLGGGSYTIMK